MAIGATTVSFSDIRTEFGGTGAVSISDYYRGGTKIRSKAANNNGTNLASTVPTSGAVNFSDYRSTAKNFKYTFTSGATDQNASDLFGDDYAVDYPKEIVINSGVELGTTNTAEFGLEIDSGGSGTVKVTNNGTITGAGGAAASAGGDAVRVNLANVTIINTGTIRGGGGGGGAGGLGGSGGTGGGGSYQTANYTYSCGSTSNCPNYEAYGICAGGCAECDYRTNYRCTTYTTTNTNGGSGGSGGSGGAGAVGVGYNQSAGTGGSGLSGSAGSSGGTNAGTGGTGGTGGSGGNGGGFGSAGSNGTTGSTGGTGANGNRTNGLAGSAGSAGASGGAAGRAVQNDVSYTMTNTGTLTGLYN